MRKNRSKTHLAQMISRMNILLNALLAIAKVGVGVLANSAAMLNDGINNASDVVSSVIIAVGITAAAKDSDKDHQYGHERMESIATLLLSTILMTLGLTLGVEGIKDIVTGSYRNRPEPAFLAVIAAIVSIIVKEIMFLVTRWGVRKTQSVALEASAWDHQSDVLATTGGLIGIIGSRLGFSIADSIAAVVIAGFIVRIGVDIFRDGMDKLVDHACPQETVDRIADLARSCSGVRSLDVLQTRQFGSRAYVDIEISVDGSLRLIEAHAIAEQVHQTIEEGIPEVKHCMVHVNPDMGDNTGIPTDY